MARKLVVGVAEADEFAQRRGYLIDLLRGLRTLGVEVRIAWLGESPPPEELATVGELRVLAPLPERSTHRLAGAVARRLGSGFEDAVADVRAREDLEWLGEPDAVHLSGVRSVRLLHYLRHPGLPVVTYVHPHDFSIAGLSEADRDLLRDRTRRFVIAEDAALGDLLDAGVVAARIERAPRRISFPAMPLGAKERRRRRIAAGLAGDRAVVAVAPVPDWFEAPDLTVSLAWELRRRRGPDAPEVLWYGMPSEGEPHWAVQADLDRLGLDDVHLVADVPSTVDLAALADVVVVPSRPQAPEGTPDIRMARRLVLPVLCWHDSPVADEMARWPGLDVAYPDVASMAETVLSLVEDTPERRRVRNTRWKALMAEVEQLAPLEVPAP
jgi:glycosyltransferase involved in cell wall biosynthesis